MDNIEHDSQNYQAQNQGLEFSNLGSNIGGRELHAETTRLLENGNSEENVELVGTEDRDTKDGNTKGSLGGNVPRKTGVIHKGNRVLFVNLFKNNRMANTDFKLQFIETGEEMLEFDYQDIDSVEKTYGICLLGYVISGKPPTAALFDLVKRWGPNVRFQTHESGWITFTFPNIEAKDRILSGGNYMVYGYHLFLKEMPRCFRFRDEDMNSLPSWIQVHGLPPDCWTSNILSKIGSRVGIPVHMDMLTHDRKRSKYARILAEIDVTRERINDMKIKLPVGVVDITIAYEQDIKYCSTCKRAGHVSLDCTAVDQNGHTSGTGRDIQSTKRNRSKSVIWRRGGSRVRSRIGSNTRRAPSRPLNKELQPQAESNKQVVMDETRIPIETECGKENHDDNSKKPCVTVEEQGENSKGEQVIDNGKQEMAENDGFKVVSNKKHKKKKHKNNTKGQKGESQFDSKMSTFFEDLDGPNSSDTEYVQHGLHGNNGNHNWYYGNEEKGRQPKIASGSQ